LIGSALLCTCWNAETPSGILFPVQSDPVLDSNFMMKWAKSQTIFKA
jgi:hypothetical protein